MRTKIALTIVSIVLSGCFPSIDFGRRSANEPVLPEEDGKNRVSVIVSSSEAPKEIKSDSNQTGASQPKDIQFVINDPNADQLKAIRKSLEPQAAPKSIDDRTTLKRSLITTVSKIAYIPSDRFVNFKISITPDNFSFVNYVGSASDYTTINIEKLELNKTNGLSGKITDAPPRGGELGFSISKGLKENGDVNTRIENMTVNLDNNVLNIYREAERGIDLAGNTVVNLSVAAAVNNADTQVKYDSVVSAIELFKSGRDLSPKEASISLQLLKHLDMGDMLATVTFDYIVRHALTKTNEYSEHNQKVAYLKGRCTKEKVVVVKQSEIVVPLWSITMGGLLLDINDDGAYRTLYFKDFMEATKTAEWLNRNKAATIGEKALRIISPENPDKNYLNENSSHTSLVVEPSHKIQVPKTADSELACAAEVPYK